MRTQAVGLALFVAALGLGWAAAPPRDAVGAGQPSCAAVATEAGAARRCTHVDERQVVDEPAAGIAGVLDDGPALPTRIPCTPRWQRPPSAPAST